MSNSDDSAKPASAAPSLAQLLAAKKAKLSGTPGAKGGQRASEREAAARSAAKSKPAMRKG
jgi:hypothetical protein